MDGFGWCCNVFIRNRTLSHRNKHPIRNRSFLKHQLLLALAIENTDDECTTHQIYVNEIRSKKGRKRKRKRNMIAKKFCCPKINCIRIEECQIKWTETKESERLFIALASRSKERIIALAQKLIIIHIRSFRCAKKVTTTTENKKTKSQPQMHGTHVTKTKKTNSRNTNTIACSMAGGREKKV